MVRVVLADDHRIFLDGLTSMLREEEQIEVVGTATSGQEVLRLIQHLDPQVAIVDIAMPDPDGIEVAERASRDFPNCAVLILTMSKEHTFIAKAREAGAKGYLLKDAGKDEFLLAIKKLAAGENHFGSDVMESLLNGQGHSAVVTNLELTERELEVLRLIAREMTALEIGKELFISENTVKTHRKNLLSKIGCKNSVGLVRFAIENDLL